MKWSEVLHISSILLGLLALAQLFGAWWVGEGGHLGDFTQGHLLVNALILILVAIWLSIGVLIHRQSE